MKYILLIAAICLFSCQKEAKTKITSRNAGYIDKESILKIKQEISYE